MPDLYQKAPGFKPGYIILTVRFVLSMFSECLEQYHYFTCLFSKYTVRGYMDQLKDKIEKETDRANEAEQEAKVRVTTDQ